MVKKNATGQGGLGQQVIDNTELAEESTTGRSRSQGAASRFKSICLAGRRLRIGLFFFKFSQAVSSEGRHKAKQRSTKIR